MRKRKGNETHKLFADLSTMTTETKNSEHADTIKSIPASFPLAFLRGRMKTEHGR